MTAAQQRALEQWIPVYGLDLEKGPLDLDEAFGRRAPRYLEIGFGDGDALLQLAQQYPERDFLGAEVHRPGVGRLLLNVAREGVTNIRVACHDGVELLRRGLSEACLDGIYVFFPDPWHKKRHHKRRLVQPEFARLAMSRLKPGGLLHLATDWQDYAHQMLEVLESVEGLENVAGPARYAERGERPQTKYERRGHKLGHSVWDLVFRRRPD